MLASQTIKIYELLNRHLYNTKDVKTVVAGIENIIGNKPNNENDSPDLKKDFANLGTRMEQGFNDQLKWTIILMLGIVFLVVMARLL